MPVLWSPVLLVCGQQRSVSVSLSSHVFNIRQSERTGIPIPYQCWQFASHNRHNPLISLLHRFSSFLSWKTHIFFSALSRLSIEKTFTDIFVDKVFSDKRFRHLSKGRGMTALLVIPSSALDHKPSTESTVVFVSQLCDGWVTRSQS